MTKLCCGRRLSTSTRESFLQKRNQTSTLWPLPVGRRGRRESGAQQRGAQGELLAGQDDLRGLVGAVVDHERGEQVGRGVLGFVAQGDDEQQQRVLGVGELEALGGHVVDDRGVVGEERLRGDDDEARALLVLAHELEHALAAAFDQREPLGLGEADDARLEGQLRGLRLRRRHRHLAHGSLTSTCGWLFLCRRLGFGRWRPGWLLGRGSWAATQEDRSNRRWGGWAAGAPAAV